MDGLRALAMLMVVCLHLGQWTGSLIDDKGRPGPLARVLNGFDVSVPLFFVISGYLLYRPWAAAALTGRRAPRAADYYWHRLIRIMPAYWLLIITSLLVFDRERLGDGWRIVRLLTVQHVEHWTDLRVDPGSVSDWAQTWSLATEVHFYLALPLIAFVLHRALSSRHGVRLALALLAGVVALDLAWLVDSSPASLQGPTGLWWLCGYVGFFAVGMALAVLVAHIDHSGQLPSPVRFVIRHPWVCWVAAAVAFALLNTPLAGGLSAPADQLEAAFRYVADLTVVVGLAAPLVFARASGPARLLSHPVLAWLGGISYGIFLWHLIVLQVTVRDVLGMHYAQPGTGAFFVLLPFVLLLSVAAGWASHQLVEAPVVRRFRRRPRG
ncbi:acyltransferase family protein [Streptomyces mauvecolor]|uniref:Acyltransferase family protein n=1 Tax=Streptomyces mauvecolor TaxID=58345 RepID=A0ABV9UMM0_9ACTN